MMGRLTVQSSRLSAMTRWRANLSPTNNQQQHTETEHSEQHQQQTERAYTGRCEQVT